MKLWKAIGKDGKLKICKLIDFEPNQVRYILEILPSSLLNRGETQPIILDTAFYWSATGLRYEVLGRNIVRLCHPHLMDGIGTFLEQPMREPLTMKWLKTKVWINYCKALVSSCLNSSEDSLSFRIISCTPKGLRIQKANSLWPGTSLTSSSMKIFLSLLNMSR